MSSTVRHKFNQGIAKNAATNVNTPVSAASSVSIMTAPTAGKTDARLGKEGFQRFEERQSSFILAMRASRTRCPDLVPANGGQMSVVPSRIWVFYYNRISIERYGDVMALLGDELRPISFAFWDRKVGPFLDREGVSIIAALTAGEVIVCQELGDLLALSTAGDSDTLYPTFQLGPRGELLPGLRDVIAALRPGSMDDWDIALWLTTVRKGFDGKRAVDLLLDGHIGIVVAAATQDGALWSSALPASHTTAQD